MKTISIQEFISYKKTVKDTFDAIGAGTVLEKQTKILLKPNLVNNSPFPITTSPDCCEAVIEYIKTCSNAEIIIAEGCGDKDLDTSDIFKDLKYTEVAERHEITLVDLNYAKLKKLSKPDCTVFPEMYLPEIAFTHYIISIPVLKAHTLSTITGSLKNMLGFAPPKYYSGRFGIWKKAIFHDNIHQSIIDLNKYRSPDLTLLDARVGMADYHLGGPQCEPPVNKIVAGFSPLAVDREAAQLLGFNWQDIPHLI